MRKVVERAIYVVLGDHTVRWPGPRLHRSRLTGDTGCAALLVAPLTDLAAGSSPSRRRTERSASAKVLP